MRPPHIPYKDAAERALLKAHEGVVPCKTTPIQWWVLCEFDRVKKRQKYGTYVGYYIGRREVTSMVETLLKRGWLRWAYDLMVNPQTMRPTQRGERVLDWTPMGMNLVRSHPEEVAQARMRFMWAATARPTTSASSRSKNTRGGPSRNKGA